MGHNAYCVIDNASSGFLEVDLVADIGQLQGEAYHLDIATDICTHATALAKVAFSELS